MIPALILYLIRRFKGKYSLSKRTRRSKKLVQRIRSIFFFFTIIGFFAFTSFNSGKSLTYNVINSDNVIGTIKIYKSVFEASEIYTLESTINAKFLLRFNIVGKEKSIYKNGLLVFSSVFRSVNNKSKTNHKIVLEDGKYKLENNGISKVLPLKAINHNLITLYYNEPIGLNSVFCDNLKKMVNVISCGNGRYRVDFQNGKSNVFYYKNGKCYKVEAKSTLFNVTLIPKL